MSGQQQQKQLVHKINQFDVLTGRGSGPYEQAGNVHFRELVARRKEEYLALNPRDSKMKNQIAKEIAEEVRSKGGRFLKKVTTSKKDRDNGGEPVYEFVDEPTVLEKAKQALRQNRLGNKKVVKQSPAYDDAYQAAALAALTAEAASMTASSSTTVGAAAPPLLPPSTSTLMQATPSNNHNHHGVVDATNGNETLNFAGITGPPPAPTTPEEWEAFHAYWSDGNEPNRRLWDQLQAQQRLLTQHQQQHRQNQQGAHHQQYQQHHQEKQQYQQQYQQQQYQQPHHHQVRQIPENAASSSYNYSAEQQLWAQLRWQHQQQQTPNITSSTNSSMGFGAAAVPGMGGQNSIQHQLDLLNSMSGQQNYVNNNEVSNQYQGYHQQQTAPIAAAGIAGDNGNARMMTAYMAQLEQHMIYEKNRAQGGHGNNAQSQSNSSLMPAAAAASQGLGFEQNEYLPEAAGSETMTAFKEHEADDHDSFFSGIKDMSLPSVSLGDLSEFGKHSLASRSGGVSKELLTDIVEDAAERAIDVKERIQEVVARRPSQKPACVDSAPPSTKPSPSASGTKRRSLSTYYREVNAAVAKSANDKMDTMSCSLQSMSIGESRSEH
mmetsp:Transcript_2603/g.4732  ORF Transcript_2603/g.4732 Transcript_2603/m.4732 type:complete len:604 (-) Transcript_2603:61-1872(-)